MRYKKLITHVESHASEVSLLERAENSAVNYKSDHHHHHHYHEIILRPWLKLLLFLIFSYPVFLVVVVLPSPSGLPPSIHITEFEISCCIVCHVYPLGSITMSALAVPFYLSHTRAIVLHTQKKSKVRPIILPKIKS